MSKIEILADGVTVYLGNCLDYIDGITPDIVVTDPPYPNDHQEAFGYNGATVRRVVEWIGSKPALIFWTSKIDLECPHTSIHIWDKKTGVQSQYERIYELNCGAGYRVANHYLINSTVAANYTRDEFTGHPSQKPVSLMKEILEWLPGGGIVDPFMGSGSTGVAAVTQGRGFIGIEWNEKYFDMALRRISKALRQQDLFVSKPPKQISMWDAND